MDTAAAAAAGAAAGALAPFLPSFFPCAPDPAPPARVCLAPNEDGDGGSDQGSVTKGCGRGCAMAGQECGWVSLVLTSALWSRHPAARTRLKRQDVSESSPNVLHQRCDELTVRPLSKRTRTVLGGESCASAAERVSVFNSRWILQQKQTGC